MDDAERRKRERERERARDRLRRSDPAYRRVEERKRQERRDRERRAAAVAVAVSDSLVPEIVALEVYRSYQERSPGWPEVPPAGLRVAVDGRSAGVVGREAVVVRLDVPGSQGLSGTPVPTLVADPSLDLANVGVRSRIFAAGADAGIYRAAESAQGVLLDVLRVEEFGADAAFPPGQGQNEEQYGHDYDYGNDYEYGHGSAESFGGVDVNDLTRSGSHLGVGGAMAEGYGGVANPVGSYAASYLPPARSYGGVPVQGADPWSTAMGAPSVTGPALPAPGSYAPAGQDSNVAYSRWDTSAFQFQRSGVQPAARDRSPSPGPSAGPSSGGRQHSSRSGRGRG
ncbi:hypothetical protein [Streptomyces ziwulingensis]|uniref:hypothetical protein n=1 Tax=Streptomyces ziwulingensis TaxID=1045501 RepID=UPI0031E62E41